MESDQVVGNRLLFSFLGRARISRARPAESNSAVARWGASWRAIPEPLRNDGAIGPTHVTDSQVLICFLFLFSVFSLYIT